MALTNSRPLQILTNMETDILHNNTSPVFQLNMNNNSTATNNNNNNNTNGNNNNNASFPGSEIVDINDITPNFNLDGSIVENNNNLNDFTNNMANDSNNNINDRNNNIYGSQKSNSSNNSTPSASKSSKQKTKKESNSSGNINNSSNNNNPLIEISKLIPVTGERPMPTDHSGPLEDNVLFAVFVILYELDAEQNGMTVKQLCDHLLVKHPEMSNLSTKLSNLISAKLNAYVKKIEKGEKTLIYAISREWSNSSPRRMLYIYRGILSPDYKEKAHMVTNQLKRQIAAKSQSNLNLNSQSSTSINSGLQSPYSGDKLLSNLNFTLTPEFNIPYSSSPVSATLNSNATDNNNNNNNNNIQQNNDLMKPPLKTPSQQNMQNSSNIKKRTLQESHENSSSNKSIKLNNKNSNSSSTSSLTSPRNIKPHDRSTSAMLGDSSNFSHSNSSTSVSLTSANLNNHNHNNNSNSNPAYVTAVSAAPRISKLLPKNGFASSSSSTNIHKFITSQTPIVSGLVSNGSLDSRTPTSSNIGVSGKSDSSHTEELSDINIDWINIVRDGFLTTDIETPESISVDDLDSMF